MEDKQEVESGGSTGEISTKGVYTWPVREKTMEVTSSRRHNRSIKEFAVPYHHLTVRIYSGYVIRLIPLLPSSRLRHTSSSVLFIPCLISGSVYYHLLRGPPCPLSYDSSRSSPNCKPRPTDSVFLWPKFHPWDSLWSPVVPSPFSLLVLWGSCVS